MIWPLLILKHLLADSILQRPYQYLNKGNLRHPGGWIHGAIHAALTALVLLVCGVSPLRSATLAAAEGLAHIGIDWSKVRICQRFRWSERRADCLAVFSDNYFHALLVDQALHYFTYCAVVALAF